MVEQIILYNLADNVTDEEYNNYVINEKGSLIESLPTVTKYELFKIRKSETGELPYKYVGIVHLTSLEEFNEKDASSEKFQGFLKKWVPMTSGFHILDAEKVY
jgi:hypothetical protein